MSESSGAPPATHTMSSCRRFAYRCRLTCFSNCTGGAECNGERIYVTTPPSTPVPALSVGPMPASWRSLQGDTPAISTLFHSFSTIIILSFRGGDEFDRGECR